MGWGGVEKLLRDTRVGKKAMLPLIPSKRPSFRQLGSTSALNSPYPLGKKPWGPRDVLPQRCRSFWNSLFPRQKCHYQEQPSSDHIFPGIDSSSDVPTLVPEDGVDRDFTWGHRCP
jgi:hypothetical protein